MRSLITIFLLSLLTAGNAQAVSSYIVDTGPGAESGGLTLTSDQWLAAKFTLDRPYTITSIEGWMVNLASVFELPVFSVIYGDAGDIPDTSDNRFEQSFDLLPNFFEAGWYGIDGLALDLDAGSYWVAFEVRDPEAFASGAMPPTPAQELSDYAFRTALGGWGGKDDANLGIRIGAVPEPGSALLIAMGLGVLSVGRSKRR